jgi:hypothetical protein
MVPTEREFLVRIAKPHRSIFRVGPMGSVGSDVRRWSITGGERLWKRWGEIDKNLDQYASRRSMETAIVVFEPRP